jgi:ATP-dependent DNA helicase PIF1
LYTSINDCISWLYPNGFDPLFNIHRTCILAVTNKQVHEWNNTIQKLNFKVSVILKSYDSFNEVDDPNNYLKHMMTEHVMNRFNDNQAPLHELELKIDDICILLANVDKQQGLTKNTRVRIVNITQRIIRVVTLNNVQPIFANLPKYNFNIKLPFNKSYKMLRRQFPLKLAYALTMNRSQGQEFEKLLVDLTIPPFTHGHLYVALSRIRESENIKIFCNIENILDSNIVLTNNVVYDEIFQEY